MTYRPRTALEIALERAERIAAEMPPPPPAPPAEPEPAPEPAMLSLRPDEIEELANSARCVCGHLDALHSVGSWDERWGRWCRVGECDCEEQ